MVIGINSSLKITASLLQPHIVRALAAASLAMVCSRMTTAGLAILGPGHPSSPPSQTIL